MTPYGERTAEILGALAQGGCTAEVIAERSGVPLITVKHTLRWLRIARKRTPKRVYIVRYVRGGQRDYHKPRAVYALGNRPDAKQPPAMDMNELARSYSKRRTVKRREMRQATNSVWAYAQTGEMRGVRL